MSQVSRPNVSKISCKIIYIWARAQSHHEGVLKEKSLPYTQLVTGYIAFASIFMTSTSIPPETADVRFRACRNLRRASSTICPFSTGSYWVNKRLVQQNMFHEITSWGGTVRPPFSRPEVTTRIRYQPPLRYHMMQIDSLIRDLGALGVLFIHRHQLCSNPSKA